MTILIPLSRSLLARRGFNLIGPFFDDVSREPRKTRRMKPSFDEGFILLARTRSTNSVGVL
jgi:hypothetical protein